jgi:hypothetical protein
VLVRTRVEKDACDADFLHQIFGKGVFLAHVEELPCAPSEQEIASAMSQGSLYRELTLVVGAVVQLLADVGPLRKYTLAAVVEVDAVSGSAKVRSKEGIVVRVTSVEQLVVCRTIEGEDNNLVVRYERWTYLPLRLGYAFTPKHASSLPLQKVHILMSTTDAHGENYHYQAFARARSWESVTWQVPEQFSQCDDAVEFASRLGLTCMGAP